MLLNLWVQCVVLECESFFHGGGPENILFEQFASTLWFGVSNVPPFSLESFIKKDFLEGHCLCLLLMSFTD